MARKKPPVLDEMDGVISCLRMVRARLIEAALCLDLASNEIHALTGGIRRPPRPKKKGA